INERNLEPQAKALSQFADLYYANAPIDELLARPLEDVYGATLSSWHFVQDRKPGDIRLRVFNPDFENDGWQSMHTVVELICDDTPFVVDSVRMQLNARQMSLHAINHCVLHACRDESGKLLADCDWSKPSEGSVAENLLFIEFDHHSDPELLADLAADLKDVLREVQCCVGDFPAILERAEQAREHLGQFKGREFREAEAFLKWLSADHFTFLACDEFEIRREGNADYVIREESHDRGSFRFSRADRSKLKLQDLPPEIMEFITSEQPVSFMKSGRRSRVHRPAYPDYVVVKRFDKKGQVVGGVRFMGLYTSMVYIETPNNIPLVRLKLDAVRDRAGFEKGSHAAKELNRILEVHPRDELFQSTVDQLHRTAISILNIQERRQTRVYLRKDPYSKFINCLVYVPRDIYNTELRQRIENVLFAEFMPTDIESTTYFSESVLARAEYQLRLNPQFGSQYDENLIAGKIRQVVRSWADDLHDALIEQTGEEKGNHYFNLYRHAFPAGYRETFTARTAVSDVQYMESLFKRPKGDLEMSFYRELEEGDDLLRFKLFNAGTILPLSDVIPVLENLGLRVLGEHPYEIMRSDGKVVWIHNFQLKYTLSDSINLAEVKSLFQDSFRAIWQGQAENDAFNRLVLGAQLGWKDIAL
ncbi:MAG: NAD-glutamate dehydrogenase, partial [Ketobacter sp.]